MRHAAWFRGAVENFRFFDLTVHPMADAGKYEPRYLGCYENWNF